MRTMTKALLALVALLALLMALIGLLSKPAEPSYQGKPLSEWFRQITVIHVVENIGDAASRNTEITAALKAMGTNCLPYLLDQLQQRDSAFKEWLYRFNYRHGFSKIPIKLRARDINQQAIVAFTMLGPIAKPAIPQLTLLMDDPGSASAAAGALVAIGPEAQPIVMQALRHTHGKVRAAVAEGIMDHGEKGSFAVPALLPLLKDPDPEVRRLAATALGRIRSNSETSVPALIKSLTDPVPLVVFFSVFALGNFRTNAAAALPALQQLLTQTNLSSNAKFNIEYAITRISPHTP